MNGEGGEFRQQCGRVESLVRALEELPDTAAREAARELLRAVLELHANGLRRLLELAGDAAVSAFATDPLVDGLLLLHGLHPVPAEIRISRVLDKIRHHFHALGGDVELVCATEELVRMRLRGNQAAERTLKALAGEVLVEAVPDVTVVEFLEDWDRDPSGRVALQTVELATPAISGLEPRT